jgi:hypothetical protein
VTQRSVDRRERPGEDVPRAAADTPVRPPRPIAVELASALLVINGLISALTSVLVAGRIAETVSGIEPLAMLMIGIGLGTAVLGLLTRYGHAWIVTINVAAVAGFLGFTSATVQGLLAGVVYVTVVLLLLWTRPWFAWSPDADDEAQADPEA